MNIDEMHIALQGAEQDLKRADAVAEKLARLLIGRMKKVGSSYILGELKKELRGYNIHTGRWSK